MPRGVSEIDRCGSSSTMLIRRSSSCERINLAERCRSEAVRFCTTDSSSSFASRRRISFSRRALSACKRSRSSFWNRFHLPFMLGNVFSNQGGNPDARFTRMWTRRNCLLDSRLFGIGSGKNNQRPSAQMFTVIGRRHVYEQGGSDRPVERSAYVTIAGYIRFGRMDSRYQVAYRPSQRFALPHPKAWACCGLSSSACRSITCGAAESGSVGWS